MKEVKIEIGTNSRTLLMPASWEELTPEQFVYIVSHQPNLCEIPTKILYHLLDITQEERLFLLPSDLYAISQQMPWLSAPEKIESWVLSEINLEDGRTVYPPSADWDNVTWEEFVFADQLASLGQWTAVAACLYRPKKDNPSENEDDRIPFTRYGASNRLAQFQKLPAPIIKAVEVNYLALRKHVTDRYRYLFSGGGSEDGGSAGWVEISHQVLGDSIWEEEQLMRTSVDQVLSHLNHVIKENQHRNRHAKNH